VRTDETANQSGARLDELLQKEIDGELAAAEAEELRRLLEEHPGLRTAAERVRAAAQALSATPTLEPPPGIPTRVMRAVAAGPVPPQPLGAFWHQLFESPAVIRTMRTPVREGGPMPSRKIVLAVAGLIALVAIGYFVIKGVPPVEQGTGATIGAAKRYQAPQIKEGDVQVTDAEVQQFLQSDTFDRLMKDDAVRKVLASPAHRMALAEAHGAFAVSDIRTALTSSELCSALENDGFRNALARSEVRNAIAAAAARGPLTKASLDADLRKAGVADVDVRGRLANIFSAAQAAALARPVALNALGHSAFQELLARPGAAAAFSRPEFANAVADKAFFAALQSPAYDAAMRAGAWGGAKAEEKPQ
jgi:hypothetical protein